jgi:spore coat polysaccharide biosynthesis protein SpsF (cytidylyltransferase family)
MKTIAIIQARMGSNRLPGKVLMDIGGKTALERVVNRLRRSTLLNDILVATTDSAADNAILGECERLCVASFRGSEDDVLDRYYQAAQVCEAEAVVRITSDCPLVDPVLLDETIGAFRGQQADYASNTIVHTYPRGLDVEIFSRTALERAWAEARNPYEREHVTPYFYEHPTFFRIASIRAGTDNSHFRWTLDTSDDLKLIREIYSRFGDQDTFGWQEALALMEREPELGEMNAHILQKSLHGV